MRALLFLVAVILAVGLFVTGDHQDTRMRVTSPSKTTESGSAVSPSGLRKAASSIAAYPDHGRLLAYDHVRRVVRSGASTWHPVQISEAHALRATLEGAMTVPAPNGETIRLNYERHVEHPDGNWTWIGRQNGSAPGTETVLTFGEKAVFGVIRLGNADLKLTTEAGSTWLVESGQVDDSELANMDDALVIPDMPVPVATSASEPLQASTAAEQQVPALVTPQAVATTVDIAMGFTTGFAARLGGESQARTRVNFLVEVTNQALSSSGITPRLRLVHALQVDYPDNTHNRTTLFDLTGVDCTTQTNGAQYLSDRRVDCTPITQSAGLQPLTAARNTYGADLLVLVRKFEAPEQGSCGSAWMLGGGQNAIDANSAAFGMTVVSDTSGDTFPDEGTTCPEVQLAHELGHNFGQQHDVITASGTDDSDSNGNLLDAEEFGRHPYSFGYSTDGTLADIATIMSNRRPTQTRYRVFANPLISSCGGAPCGTADQADNARSMGQTMPVIAGFRATVVAEPLVSFPGSLIGVGGKCLDAAGGGTTNGTPIQVWACNGLRQQVWVPAINEGTFFSWGSSRVLDVIGFSANNGAQLQLWSATGNSNQMWYFAQAAIVANGGRVLDAVGASSLNGTRMQLWDDLGGSNQRWLFDVRSGQIIGKDGKCLDITGFSTLNGTPVQFWTCSGTDNQKWAWGANGTIRGYGGKCLEAANGGAGNGTEVRIWDCNGGAHQTWRIRGEVRSVMTDKCLDDPGFGAINGSRVHMWDCHGGQNQKWEFSSQ